MAKSFFAKLATCLAVLSFPRSTLSLGKTDTITWGGDVSRTGYETTHNLDPQTVSSSDFGNLWTAKLPGNFNGIGAEQVLSQPLVYTTGDGVQYVFIATTQNNLYKINAKTGDIVKSRNIGVPFLTADIGGCNDIFPAIGVTGTGVIDPATGLWYLTSKTYSDAVRSPLCSAIIMNANNVGSFNLATSVLQTRPAARRAATTFMPSAQKTCLKRQTFRRWSTRHHSGTTRTDGWLPAINIRGRHCCRSVITSTQVGHLTAFNTTTPELSLASTRPQVPSLSPTLCSKSRHVLQTP